MTLIAGKQVRSGHTYKSLKLPSIGLNYLFNCLDYLILLINIHDSI